MDSTFNTMEFGTRTYRQLIPCPAIEGDHSSVGWSTSAQYLNGGAFVRNSAASHREFNLSWNLASRTDLQPLYDYAAEIYGPPPYFFIDPFSADLNVMPEWYAAPGMATMDAPTIVGENRPTRVINTDQSQGYPSVGASYAVSSGLERRPLYIPVPTGKVLWIGVHGFANDASHILVTPFNGTVPGTAVPITNLGLNTNVRCNYSFSSATGVTGVEVSVGGTGVLSIFGIIAQVLDIGITPDNGGFVGGMGHSGVEFSGKPTKLAYSTAFDLIGASATLVETEGWR